MKRIGFLFWIILFSSILLAQKTDDQMYLLTTKTNTFGYSNLNLIDPYLSPLSYSGNGIQYAHESRRFLSIENTNISMQHNLDLELAYLLNPAQTSNMIYMDAKYDWGMHYHFRPMKGLVLMAGGSWDVDLGYKEVFRNINNPGNVDLATNLNLSGVAMYDIPFCKRILRLKLSVETPIFGWMYVPLAGASYYEMFDIGNLSNVSHISSIINRRGVNPKLTVDIPFRYSVWQVGIKYQRLQYSANNMVFDRKELSLLIGKTFDMIEFGGRRRMAPKNFISTNE
jgi:hypothetical protein